MEQFVAVALAHFLALLIPGVDFFLVVRTAAAHGWRVASGTCVGIATANAIFIAAAFGGLSLIGDDVVLAVVELAGGVFLVWMGAAFWRARNAITTAGGGAAGRAAWGKNLGLGLTSGLLNPKNLLFYVSLAAATTSVSPGLKVVYGVWMFAVVLGWDLFVAGLMGAPRNRAVLDRALPWVTRFAAIVVALFGAGAVVTAFRTLLG